LCVSLLRIYRNPEEEKRKNLIVNRVVVGLLSTVSHLRFCFLSFYSYIENIIEGPKRIYIDVVHPPPIKKTVDLPKVFLLFRREEKEKNI
jgi:hypothetical protein